MSISGKRGISPLIAAIVLVSIVVVLGNLIGGWFLDFAGEKTEGAIGMGEDEVDCAYASLKIIQVRSNSENITVDVENTGDVDLSHFRAELLNENSTPENLVPVGSERVLVPGSLMVFFLEPEDGTEDINEIEFYSKNCTEETRSVAPV